MTSQKQHCMCCLSSYLQIKWYYIKLLIDNINILTLHIFGSLKRQGNFIKRLTERYGPLKLSIMFQSCRPSKHVYIRVRYDKYSF